MTTRRGVRLVLDESKTVAAVARDLGLTESSLRNWVEQARADRTKGRSGLTTAEREELVPLRKESRIVQEEREILKSGGLLREAEPMRFTFIAAKRAEHTVTILCRCLRVTRSGFYACQGRAESTHARDDRRLKVLVQASFHQSKQRYGSPRVHEDLIEQQERVSRKRVIYIEVFYNQRRRHSTLSQVSPATFERRAAWGDIANWNVAARSLETCPS